MGRRHDARQGAVHLPNGNTYEGAYENGVRHGKGKFVYANGGVYSGGFKNGTKMGHGTYTDPQGTLVYEGQWEDKEHGEGKFIFPNGAIYEGQFIKGKKEGKAKYSTRAAPSTRAPSSRARKATASTRTRAARSPTRRVEGRPAGQPADGGRLPRAAPGERGQGAHRGSGGGRGRRGECTWLVVVRVRPLAAAADVMFIDVSIKTVRCHCESSERDEGVPPVRGGCTGEAILGIVRVAAVRVRVTNLPTYPKVYYHRLTLNLGRSRHDPTGRRSDPESVRDVGLIVRPSSHEHSPPGAGAVPQGSDDVVSTRAEDDDILDVLLTTRPLRR